jgi:type III secretion system FlhB-like substrate exporter
LAKGREAEAERIITLARKAGVDVVEDPALAAMLDTGAGIGDIIPVWCWEAAAKLLAFVRHQAAGEKLAGTPGAGIQGKPGI